MADKTQKIASYDKEKGILFLINKVKPKQNIKLFTVKLTNEISEDHEEEQNMKLYFVTETKLTLSNQLL